MSIDFRAALERLVELDDTVPHNRPGWSQEWSDAIATALPPACGEGGGMNQRLKYLAWREENVKRLSQVADWRELCLELLEAANEMTVVNDDSDKHFNVVVDRVHQLAADTLSPAPNHIGDPEQ
jgi:hypothetical protein